MHYYALVVIPEDAEPQEAIAAAMEPYSEYVSDDGWWDWWQFGGRYTGQLDGYNPNTDPANQETCNLCDGTGVRPDMWIANGCNGCAGNGTRVKWPTSWGERDGDIGRIADVSEPPFTLVTPNGVFHRDHWDGEEFVDQTGELEKAFRALAPDTRVAVVDYHS